MKANLVCFDINYIQVSFGCPCVYLCSCLIPCNRCYKKCISIKSLIHIPFDHPDGLTLVFLLLDQVLSAGLFWRYLHPKYRQRLDCLEIRQQQIDDYAQISVSGWYLYPTPTCSLGAYEPSRQVCQIWSLTFFSHSSDPNRYKSNL